MDILSMTEIRTEAIAVLREMLKSESAEARIAAASAILQVTERSTARRGQPFQDEGDSESLPSGLGSSLASRRIKQVARETLRFCWQEFRRSSAILSGPLSWGR